MLACCTPVETATSNTMTALEATISRIVLSSPDRAAVAPGAIELCRLSSSRSFVFSRSLRKAGPDTLGEVRRLVRGLGYRVDVDATLQLLEGHASVEAPAVVDVLGRVPAHEHLPRIWQVAGVHGRMREDHGGAVGRERVVEAGVLPHLVDVVDIFEEDAATVLDRGDYPEEMDVFRGRLPVVGAHPDDVALVGDDVHQLVLLEEAGHRRVWPRAVLARLDRDGQVI